MPQIKLRVLLNEGREGTPLDKLGGITQEMDKFLRMLAVDIGIHISKGDFVTSNFRNGSVLFDVKFAGTADETSMERYQKGFQYVSQFPYDNKSNRRSGRTIRRSALTSQVKTATIAQYAKMGKIIDPDEKIGMALYGKRGIRKKDWSYLSRVRASEIMDALEDTVEYIGSIQGVISALHKEAMPPFIILKELSTDTLIKCIYGPHQYPSIVHALKERDAVVHVGGLIKASRIEQKPVRMQVEEITISERLLDEHIERFFGCVPKMTGDLSTADYIEHIRERSN